jgi:hypothetical protein
MLHQILAQLTIEYAGITEDSNLTAYGNKREHVTFALNRNA